MTNADEPDGLLPVPTERPTSVRYGIVALLLAYSLMSWFNRVSISVAYDERIRHDVDISEEAIGVVYSTFLFMYAIFMTPGGWLADRYGAWRALVIMGLGSAVFGALTGLVGLAVAAPLALWVSFLVIRGGMGAFTAPIYPASGRIIAHWLPFPQRAWANGMVSAAALVGIAVTFEGFGHLIDWFGWQIAFLLTGVVTGGLGLLWLVYARDYPWQHRGVNQAERDRIDPKAPSADLDGAASISARHSVSWLRLLRNRSLVCLTLSYAAVGYFEYLFFFWMHYYFDEVLKVGKSESRLYATVLYLAMAAGMTVGGWLSDRLQLVTSYRLSRALVPAVGMLAGAALLGMGVLATEPVSIVIWFSLALAAVGACEGPCWATAIELGGPSGATSAGIFNTGGNLAGLVAPVLTPFISRRYGWAWGIALGGIVCLVGALLWIWIDPHERNENGDHSWTA